MKAWKKLLLCVVLPLLALLALVCFLPARWVAPWVQAHVHGTQLRQVGGLVWDGHADQVVAADGTVLGRLQWQLSRRALLGDVHLTFRLDGPVASAAGSLERQAGDMRWQDVGLQLHLDTLSPPVVTPLGSPRGELAAHVEHAQMRAGWPMSVAATVQWRQASVRAGTNDIALGTLELHAAGSNGVIRAALQDDGHGPLRVRGALQVSPLGWRFSADLTPLDHDPALRDWLARLGRPDPQGTVHIQRGAGVGAMPAFGVTP